MKFLASALSILVLYFIPADKTARRQAKARPIPKIPPFKSLPNSSVEKPHWKAKPPSSPFASYQEQSGTVTFSQIETSELILRFTPIPLRFGKEPILG